MLTPAEIANLLSHFLPALDPQAPGVHKDQRSQTAQFVGWLRERQNPIDPNLLHAYRVYLEEELQLKASSIRAHLASVRAWLRRLLRDPQTVTACVDLLPGEPDHNRHEVNELINRLWANLDREFATIAPAAADRLPPFCPTVAQAQQLMDRLDWHSRAGLRDAAVVVSLLVLGLRQAEVCALEVGDFTGAETSPELHIPDAPGCTARVIGLQDFPEVVKLIRRWLRRSQITGGPLFRGFYRGGGLRSERMSLRSVERILEQYPVVVEDAERVLKPLELRRFAARGLAQRGYSLETIRSSLGLNQLQAVIDYLGGDVPSATVEAPLVFRYLNFWE